MNGDEAKAAALADDLDYQALGFMCGLEIHQQLDTRKLFSLCPSEVVDPDAVTARAIAQYDRTLRAAQSELGETDPAVLAELRKQKRFRYIAIDGLTSLVELDEEPPLPMSEDALDVTLTFAGLLGSRPADEVHVMRKTVIDGSNTSGFQRTSLIATGGKVTIDDGDVGIWTVAVEEDSARKLRDEGGIVTYTLDRLGIPLIEVATAPDITDPLHAQATAARLGALLRATGRVKRGLGTIRQDLNVSVGVGDRVEIKGCQDLRSVPQVIEYECRRQLWMHHIAEELKARGFNADQLGDAVDVSEDFADCGSKMIASSLKKKQKVMALALPTWAGLIAGASNDGPRMGREFADHAKVRAGVKGVFHSDELPAYGIEAAEVEAVRSRLGLGADDGFVLCVEKERVARHALEAVAERAVAAIQGPQREVRAAQQDTSSRYMRPLPGAARMYPETDVPPITITADKWQQILSDLPPLPEERIKGYVDDHGLSTDMATQIVKEGLDGDFDAWLDEGLEATFAARVLLQFLPDGAAGEALKPRVPEVYAALQAGRFAKEAVRDILETWAKDLDQDLEAAIAAAGAEAVDESEVDAIIDKVVGERIDFVKERGMGAIGPLMGPAMAELRGKADGQVVSSKLKDAIQKILA